MAKLVALHKQLRKTVLIATIASAVLSSAAFAAYSWGDQLSEDVRAANNQLGALRAEVVEREQKNEDAKKYVGLYQALSQGSGKQKLSDFNRNKAQKWLAETAKLHGLVKLDGTFSAVQEIENPDFKMKTLQGMMSKVVVQIGGMSDEDMINFMLAVAQDFPGYVKIHKFTLVREKQIDDAAMKAASAGESPLLVNGELEFDWIGVREVVQPQGSETQTEPGGGA